VAAILVVRYGLSFWLALPLAGLFCAFASMAIGLPILRLRGVYFAMVTLVLTEVVRLLALALPITNGAKGIVNIPLPGPVSPFGLTLIPDFSTLENPRRAFYILSAVLMILSFASLYRLVHSRIGQLCRSLQQNEELAASIGVNVAALRVVAFAVSSFFGGLGGAIFAFITQSIYPNSFTVADSVNFMLNCFLGGLNYVFGPIVGTFVLYYGWDVLFQTGRFQLLIFSSILIALMLVLPNGLLSVRLPVRRKPEATDAARPLARAEG
jgi:branched-chain amino acid transport system permease protein